MSADSVADGLPDLQQLGCETINRFMMGEHLPESERLAKPLIPDDVTVRCQRIWPQITTFNPHINGAAFAAGVVQAESDGRLVSFFVEAIKPPGATEWSVGGSSGGRQPEHMRDRAGGFLLVGGSFACVGGLGIVPDGGSVRVEMANGDVFESGSEDGCCIVFAPVTSEPSPDDHVTVRYLGPNGDELAANTVFIGDGKPPPGVRPAAG